MRRATVLVLLFLLGVCGVSRAGQTPADRQPEMRWINVSVKPKATGKIPGKDYILGLQSTDFIVTADGKPLPIKGFSKPLEKANVAVILDTSGSMQISKSPTKVEIAQQCVQYLMSVSGTENEYCLIQAADTARLLQGWTRDRAAMGQPPETPAPSKTAMATAFYDALALACDQLAKTGTSRKVILAMSDCEDTFSKTPYKDITRRLREQDVLVCFLNFGGLTFNGGDTKATVTSECTKKIGRELALASGGIVAPLKDKTTFQEAIEEIAAHILAHYQIGIVPTPEMMASDKTLKITVDISPDQKAKIGEATILFRNVMEFSKKDGRR